MKLGRLRKDVRRGSSKSGSASRVLLPPFSSAFAFLVLLPFPIHRPQLLDRLIYSAYHFECSFDLFVAVSFCQLA